MNQNNKKRKQIVFISTVSIILLIALVLGVVALVISTSLKFDDDYTLRTGSYRLETLEEGQSCPFDTFTLTVKPVALGEDVLGAAPLQIGVEASEDVKVKVGVFDHDILALTLSAASGEYNFSGKLISKSGAVSEIKVTLEGAGKSYSFALAYQK